MRYVICTKKERSSWPSAADEDDVLDQHAYHKSEGTRVVMEGYPDEHEIRLRGKNSKSLSSALPAYASLKRPLSAKTTSAGSSGCGIASLATARNRLSTNAPRLPARAKAWSQSVGRGPDRTCALHGLVLHETLDIPSWTITVGAGQPLGHRGGDSQSVRDSSSIRLRASGFIVPFSPASGRPSAPRRSPRSGGRSSPV